ncbi:MAG TPA: phytoene/squalene synthase family protein [Mycobacteriales bacterium]
MPDSWTARRSVRELDAAGIAGPALRASYEECRRLNARHGRTYYLATLLLPSHKRPAVHALYGFARYADEIVDDLERPLPPPEAAARLDALERDLHHPRVDEPPVLQAFRDTHERYEIAYEHTATFLASMRTDLSATTFTAAELDAYMAGSAGAIALQMLPVLGYTGPYEVVAPYAMDLAVAFQLTNFVRDVDEDARRGRRYLDDPRAAAGRARRLYRSAEQGIRLLDPTSRDCVRTAAVLYERILDEVERRGFDTRERATVGRGRRLMVAVPAAARAIRARRGAPTTPTSTASG